MSNKRGNTKSRSLDRAYKVIFRIIKDTRPILPWLILTAFISLLSIGLSMVAPELIGELTDTIYAYVTNGEPIALSDFGVKCIILAAAYLLSGILGVVTMVLMNNIVSRHYTCRIRIDMSDKISRIPIKQIDTTPNGEIISRMTNDVSIMGGSVHDIFNIIINGVIKLAVITTVIFISDPMMACAVVIFVPASMFLAARLASRNVRQTSHSIETSLFSFNLITE